MNFWQKIKCFLRFEDTLTLKFIGGSYKIYFNNDLIYTSVTDDKQAAEEMFHKVVTEHERDFSAILVEFTTVCDPPVLRKAIFV